jgi:hypothetical protein
MKKPFEMLLTRAGAVSMLAVSVALLGGCGSDGGGGASSTVSGTVTQGQVKDAVVFADHLSGDYANRILDDANANSSISAADSEGGSSTTTDKNGDFTLTEPGYDYVIVSVGGTDLLSGQPAMQMLAPAGAKNISPLTTMVALTPEGTERDAIIATIESLGISYDDDLSQNITPAAAIVVHSIQSAVTTMTNALTTDSTGAQTVSNYAVGQIQEQVLYQVKEQIKSASVADLTDSTTLSTKLGAAVTNSITVLADSTGSASGGAVITITDSAAISNAVVSSTMTVADGIITASGTSADSADAQMENAIVPSSVVAANNTATSTATQTATTSGGITVVPPSNAAPTITGTPSSTVKVGESYSFKPSASDSDVGDTLVFSINQTLPAGLTFNKGTGEISGTPTSSASLSNIVISVTDGVNTVSLPAFNLTVQSTTGGSGTGG